MPYIYLKEDPPIGVVIAALAFAALILLVLALPDMKTPPGISATTARVMAGNRFAGLDYIHRKPDKK